MAHNSLNEVSGQPGHHRPDASSNLEAIQNYLRVFIRHSSQPFVICEEFKGI